MPVYHSTQNEVKGTPICNTVVLPIKTKVKGPAPPARPTGDDIIDEAINFYRANVLYRQYESQGPADLTVCYLTVFIGEILRAFVKCKNQTEAKKNITAISMSQTFSIPGDKKFCLPGFFKAPENRTESDSFRNYFRQVREETVNRLLEVAYLKDGNPNKWWMMFSKRKFMNITDTA